MKNKNFQNQYLIERKNLFMDRKVRVVQFGTGKMATSQRNPPIEPRKKK